MLGHKTAMPLNTSSDKFCPISCKFHLKYAKVVNFLVFLIFCICPFIILYRPKMCYGQRIGGAFD